MGTKVGVADFGVGFVIPLGIPSNLHDHLPLWQFDRKVLHSWNVLNVSPADVSLKHSLPTYPLLGMSPRFKTHPASSDIYVSTAFNAVPIVFVLFCAVWSNCHNRVHWRRRNGCGYVETAVCVINTVFSSSQNVQNVFVADIESGRPGKKIDKHKTQGIAGGHVQTRRPHRWLHGLVEQW